VPGWIRYNVADEKLKQMAGAKQPAPIETSQARQQRAIRMGGPGDPADQEKLFQQFLEWSKKQSNKQR
jgi:hypothetical protein